VSADLRDLVNILSNARSLRPYQPEDREAEAAKIRRLRERRLALRVQAQRNPRRCGTKADDL
jgi:hypothetical protein